jgi:putative DNA primase/helicase
MVPASAHEPNDPQPIRLGPGIQGLTREGTAVVLSRQGFYTTVIDPELKKVVYPEWGKHRLDEAQVREKFRAKPRSNVGLVIGPDKGPSGEWIVDIEGDGAEAEESRAKLLGDAPPTLSWESQRGVHQVYYVADPDRMNAIAKRPEFVNTGIWKVPGLLPGLELRIGRGDLQYQGAIPPSVNGEGIPRSWIDTDGIAPLPDAFYEFFEAQVPAPAPELKLVQPPDASTSTAKTKGLSARAYCESKRPDKLTRASAYLAKCDPAISGQRGHDTTFRVTINVGRGFDLTQDECFDLMWAEYNPRCQPPWLERDLRHKVDDAYKREPDRRWLLDEDSPVPVTAPPAGASVPAGAPAQSEDEAPVERPDDNWRLARVIVAGRYTHEGRPTLLYYRGQFYEWQGGAYRAVRDSEMKADVGLLVRREFEQAYAAEQDAGKADTKPVEMRRVTDNLIRNVLVALECQTVLKESVCPNAPCWLGGPGPWPAHEVFPCRNALIHLPSMVQGLPDYVVDPTPSFFSTYSAPYDFDPDAPAPTRWLVFLDSVWPNDPESVTTLQEWFGLTLIGDTSHQKALALIGPPRAGKDTIARVNRDLIGEENTAAPTISSLGANFGLEPLIGKPLAVIGDARVGGRTDTAAVVERLLTITGEGTLTIDRKHRESWTGQLPTRFVFISNELPKLVDSSGALLGRLVLLRFTESFLGKEDRNLRPDLAREMPGIFLWAVAGWKRLRERGHFIQPRSGKELLADMEGLTSPIKQFIRDRLDVAPNNLVTVPEVFAAWKEHCEDTGNHFGTTATLGKNLRAALPKLKTTQVRTDKDKVVRAFKGIALRGGSSPLREDVADGAAP